jgi:HPt (histidine-containing phosphotransfer) domain-containing protein
MSDTGTSCTQCRVTPHTRGEGRDGSADNNPYRTAYLDRSSHAGAVGCSQTGDITLVKAPFESQTDAPDHTRYVSFDSDREKAVVAVRASGPLQYVMSLATALASPRLINRVLTDSRLKSLEDPPAILRDARCIGGLSDEALDEPETLREVFIEWGTDLEDLTAKLSAGEYEDRNRFRSSIMRSAHGLAGSLAHLFDTLEIDIVRELRVPSGLDSNALNELATSISIATAIQSKYGAFACYRQLFESREEKRQTALSPTVDADDPLGTLIGSLVVRGQDVHRLRPKLEQSLETPAVLAEDAPEFAVHVSISTVNRTAYAAAATRILKSKNLRPTRDIVSLLHALAGSPFAAAQALQQLAGEDERRELRPDELRYALGTLEPEQLLSDLPATVGRIVHTLLTAESRLSQRELANRADISARTI